MIKIHLSIIHSTVVYAVLDQDDKLHSNGTKLSFKASNGIQIVSSFYPDIERNTVFIRGDSSNIYEGPNKVSTISFSNREEALKYHASIIDAFKEFKDNNYFDGVDSDKSEITLDKDEYLF